VSRPARKVRLDDVRELEQSHAVGDAAPVALNALRELFLGPAELGEEALIGLRFLHRVQILAEQVLDQGQLEALRVGHLANDRGDVDKAGQLGGPPAALADDQLIAFTNASDDDGLEYAALRQRCC